MLTTIDTTVRATGNAKTGLEAFQAAVRDMRSKVMAEHDEAAILHMEPADCRVIRAGEHTRTERFFGVLFPRTVSTHELVVEFTVRMKVIDMTALRFTRSREQLSPAQHLLQMR